MYVNKTVLNNCTSKTRRILSSFFITVESQFLDGWDLTRKVYHKIEVILWCKLTKVKNLEMFLDIYLRSIYPGSQENYVKKARINLQLPLYILSRVLEQSIQHASGSTINSRFKRARTTVFLNEKQTAEVLFRLYYKKCKSEQLSSEDMNIIRRAITRTDKSMYIKVLSYGAETLLKENLNASGHTIRNQQCAKLYNCTYKWDFTQVLMKMCKVQKAKGLSHFINISNFDDGNEVKQQYIENVQAFRHCTKRNKLVLIEKVDLIIPTFHNGVKYEPSSNEWKREKGYTGYIYTLKFVDGLFANIYDTLQIPTNIIQSNNNGLLFLVGFKNDKMASISRKLRIAQYSGRLAD
ncbi:hypothetical protein BDC45DRAFT_592673 [Circinella umbellata]|nr:hypothetical protein BDC45DRAFT_592673 [Circinella umbellata]